MMALSSRNPAAMPDASGAPGRCGRMLVDPCLPWVDDAACRPLPPCCLAGGRPPRRHAEHSRCRREFVTGARSRRIARKPHAQADSAPPAGLATGSLVRHDAAARAAAATVAACCIMSSPFSSSSDAPADQVERICEAIDALAATLPEVRSGGRRASISACARATRASRSPLQFDDVDGFKVYADHPEHVRIIKEMIAPHIDSRQPGAVHGLTSRSSEPSGAPRSAALGVLEEEPVLDDAGHGLDGGGERGEVGPGRERAVEEVVALVGDERRAVGARCAGRRRRAGRSRRARVPSQPKRTTSTGRRQRSPRCVDELARLGHDHAARRRLDHELLAQQRAAAALEHGQLARHLVGAVEREVELGRLLRARRRGAPPPPPDARSRATAQTTSSGRAPLAPSARADAPRRRGPSRGPRRMPGSTSSSAARTAAARAASALSA